MSDIVDTLRGLGRYQPSPFLKAADEIDRLRAEVQEQARINGMGAERELALQAKIARLREALREIAESDDVDNALDPHRNKRLARAALAEKEKKS